MKTVLIMLFTLSLLVGVCEAGEIPEDKAVQAILGEARGDYLDRHDTTSNYIPMLAIACALRNRGDLKGVYGLRADVSDSDTKTLQRAYKAWNMSQYEDITHGATHWLSEYDIKVAGNRANWRYQMICTAKIGQTYFYKEG